MKSTINAAGISAGFISLALTGAASAAVVHDKGFAKITANPCRAVGANCNAGASIQAQLREFSTNAERDIIVFDRTAIVQKSNLQRAAMIQTILNTRTTVSRGEKPHFNSLELVSLQEFQQTVEDSGQPVITPLPGAVWGMLLGLLGLGALTRRKTRAA